MIFLKRTNPYVKSYDITLINLYYFNDILAPISQWYRWTQSHADLVSSAIKMSNIFWSDTCHIGRSPSQRSWTSWRRGTKLCASVLSSFQLAVCQNLVPLVNIKIAGKWMFIPLKMVSIGIDPYPILFWWFLPGHWCAKASECSRCSVLKVTIFCVRKSSQLEALNCPGCITLWEGQQDHHAPISTRVFHHGFSLFSLLFGLFFRTMGAMMELTRKSSPESGTCPPEQLVPSCQARKCSGNRFLFSNPYVVSMVILPIKVPRYCWASY